MSTAFVQRIAEMARGFQQARIVLLGIELGVYEQLAGGPATAASLARQLGCTERGMEILLDALVALEILQKETAGDALVPQGARYCNSPGAQASLVRSAKGSMAHILGHMSQLYGEWGRLDETIRAGQKTEQQALVDPVANRNFILGMAEVSRPRVAPIVDALPLEGATHFIDLGGGPAHYACEAARRHPRLRATLIDLPLTVDVAREVIEGQGLGDRVATSMCDFYQEDTLPAVAPADVMLVSQVLHAEGPEQNRALLQKCAALVKPGGSIVIIENLVHDDRSQPLAGALFAVNMLAATHRGRTYTAGEIGQWLTSAGFEPRAEKGVVPGAGLIEGIKR